MPNLARAGRLVVASHNAGKVSEITGLIAPFGVGVVSAAALHLPEPDETGDSFEENALIKARAAAMATRLPALADDSGLCVDALSGAPGIHSARWAGPNKDFARAMARIEDELEACGAQSLRAHFVCVLAMAWPDGSDAVFRGEMHGRVVFPPRGRNGFGYDPIFVADGMDRTFGEIEPAQKHAMSHRAKAFAKLIEVVF